MIDRVRHGSIPGSAKSEAPADSHSPERIKPIGILHDCQFWHGTNGGISSYRFCDLKRI